MKFTQASVTTEDWRRQQPCNQPNEPDADADDRWLRIKGQTIRILLPPVLQEPDGHTWWQVHPEDVVRLTPEFGDIAHVCSHILECD